MATDAVLPKRAVGRPSRFSEEDIRRCLLTLAKHAGNTVRAAAELTEGGTPISNETLRTWRDGKHAELYRHLHDQYGHEIEQALIPHYRELALTATEAAKLAVTKTIEQLEAGNCKDPAGTARNLSTTGAIAMDKLYLATDRPTEIHHNLTADELLDRLEARTPKAINTTATELTEPDQTTTPQTHTTQRRFLESASQ